MTEPDFTEQIEIQDVWRHMSANKNSTGGFVVWEVRQVIGKPYNIHPNFYQTQDGGWVYVSCDFMFDKNSAENVLNYPGMYEDLHIV